MDTSREMSVPKNRPFIKRSIHYFYTRLLKPRSTDEDNKRREYILNIILLGSIVMLLLLDSSVLYYSTIQGENYGGIPFFAFSLIPLFFIFLHFLSRRGWHVIASYLLIAAYFLSNSYAAYHWGVHLHAAVLGYALIITISSILLGTRFGFLVTGAIAAYIIPLWYAQFHGRIPLQVQRPNASDAAVFASLYAIIMIVAWLSNREIEKSLSRARTSEGLLKEERDVLDIRVEERTQELRQTQLEQIDQLYRFAEFGQLASGLFHDLVNMLNAVSLKVEQDSNDSSTKAETEVKLQNARNVHRQIELFMEGLRKQLSSQDTVESFSLADSINQAIQLLSYKAHKNYIRLVFHHLQTDSFPYLGNPFKFHQVVLNLIQNAIESYDGVPADPQRERAVTINLTKEKDHVKVQVKDCGSGIPESLREKIFEPFFTTKGQAKGVGIGLATTKRIVERDLKGSLEVESVEGEGSTFTVIFPMTAPAKGKDGTEHA